MSANLDSDPDFTDSISKPNPRRKNRLLSIVATVGILMLLIALLLPAIRSGAGPAARRAQCTNNLKQIALALHQYEQSHKALPPAYTVDASGRPLHSWRTLILPYLEQSSLYQTIDLSKPWNDPANAKAYNTPLSVFRCPEQVGPPNTTTYLAVVGPQRLLSPRPASTIGGDHGRSRAYNDGDRSQRATCGPLDGSDRRERVSGAGFRTDDQAQSRRRNECVLRRWQCPLPESQHPGRGASSPDFDLGERPGGIRRVLIIPDVLRSHESRKPQSARASSARSPADRPTVPRLPSPSPTPRSA